MTAQLVCLVFIGSGCDVMENDCIINLVDFSTLQQEV